MKLSKLPIVCHKEEIIESISTINLAALLESERSYQNSKNKVIVITGGPETAKTINYMEAKTIIHKRPWIFLEHR